jgi:hypothetical protein
VCSLIEVLRGAIDLAVSQLPSSDKDMHLVTPAHIPTALKSHLLKSRRIIDVQMNGSHATTSLGELLYPRLYGIYCEFYLLDACNSLTIPVDDPRAFVSYVFTLPAWGFHNTCPRGWNAEMMINGYVSTSELSASE